MKNIILFGASKFGEGALKILQGTNNVIGFIDNDEKKWGTEFNELPVYSPSFLDENDIEVIITSSYSDEIANRLQEKGFLNYSIFNFYLNYPALKSSISLEHSLPVISMGKLIEEMGGGAINDLTFLSGGSTIMDYFFLKALMKRCNLKTYLEIGTWTGESIAAVAETAEKCYSISLPDEDQAMIKTFEDYCNKSNFSRYFSKKNENITHFYESSFLFDYSQIKEKIDLVFIDGDHSFKGIKTDTRNIFDLVGFEDTIVVWHDFKTIRNQLVQTTYEAVRSEIPEKYLENLFVVQSNICGVYLPKKYQDLFTLENDKNAIYSYKVELKPKYNHL